MTNDVLVLSLQNTNNRYMPISQRHITKAATVSWRQCLLNELHTDCLTAQVTLAQVIWNCTESYSTRSFIICPELSDLTTAKNLEF